MLCVRSWVPDGAVKIPMQSSGPQSVTPISIPSMFSGVVDRHPGHLALHTRDRHGQDIKWTYEQYMEDVRYKVHQITQNHGIFNNVNIGLQLKDSLPWVWRDTTQLVCWVTMHQSGLSVMWQLCMLEGLPWEYTRSDLS